MVIGVRYDQLSPRPPMANASILKNRTRPTPRRQKPALRYFFGPLPLTERYIMIVGSPSSSSL